MTEPQITVVDNSPEITVGDIVPEITFALTAPPQIIVYGPGTGGGNAGGYYVHEQLAASALWVVPHELRYFPNVTVVSEGGILFGDIEYIDDKNLEISFSAPYAGTAYLS